MRYIVTLLILVAVGIAAVSVFVWSGSYNIAANAPHWDITHRVLETVRERSIEAHSKGITIPPLSDPKLLQQGISEFHETCRLCHGAPGVPREPFAMGLYPSPPNLASPHLQEELKEAGIFWVVKNGLKMTGMPSFSSTADDQEIWGVVAFLKRLPNLKSEEYRSMVQATGMGT